MDKRIAILLLGIFFISLTVAIFPGETITVKHDLNSANLTYSIQNNETPINISEFIISTNSTHSNITFPTNLPPTSFEILIKHLEEEKEVVIFSSGGSSGSGSGGGFIENCSGWSFCNESKIQSKICTTNGIQTITKRSCEYIAPEISNNSILEETNNESETEQETKETSGFLSLTGNVIQATGKTVSKPQVAIPLGVILLGGAFFIFVKRKKKIK